MYFPTQAQSTIFIGTEMSFSVLEFTQNPRLVHMLMCRCASWCTTNSSDLCLMLQSINFGVVVECYVILEGVRSSISACNMGVT